MVLNKGLKKKSPYMYGFYLQPLTQEHQRESLNQSLENQQIKNYFNVKNNIERRLQKKGTEDFAEFVNGLSKAIGVKDFKGKVESVVNNLQNPLGLEQTAQPQPSQQSKVFSSEQREMSDMGRADLESALSTPGLSQSELEQELMGKSDIESALSTMGPTQPELEQETMKREQELMGMLDLESQLVEQSFKHADNILQTTNDITQQLQEEGNKLTADYESRINNLNNILNQERESHSKSIQEIQDNINDRIEGLKNTYDTNIQTYKDRIESITKAREDLINQVERRVREDEEQIRRLEMAGRDNEVAELKNNIEGYKRQKEKYGRVVDELRDERDKYKSDYQTAVSNLSDSHRTIQKLDEKIENTTNKFKEHQNQLLMLMEEQQQRADADKSKNKKRIKKLKSKLVKDNSLINTLENKLSNVLEQSIMGQADLESRLLRPPMTETGIQATPMETTTTTQTESPTMVEQGTQLTKMERLKKKLKQTKRETPLDIQTAPTVVERKVEEEEKFEEPPPAESEKREPTLFDVQRRPNTTKQEILEKVNEVGLFKDFDDVYTKYNTSGYESLSNKDKQVVNDVIYSTRNTGYEPFKGRVVDNKGNIPKGKDKQLKSYLYSFKDVYKKFIEKKQPARLSTPQPQQPAIIPNNPFDLKYTKEQEVRNPPSYKPSGYNPYAPVSKKTESTLLPLTSYTNPYAKPPITAYTNPMKQAVNDDVNNYSSYVEDEFFME